MHALEAAETVATAAPMRRVREAAGRLEALVAADLWPLPSYREMLFIR